MEGYVKNDLDFDSLDLLYSLHFPMILIGKYNGKTVAVKIVWDEELYNDEVEIYQALGSMTNTKIEDKGIAKVYFHGKVLAKYFGIAMTLFDGTLLDRYEIQHGHFSNLTILLIFRRLVSIKPV